MPNPGVGDLLLVTGHMSNVCFWRAGVFITGSTINSNSLQYIAPDCCNLNRTNHKKIADNVYSHYNDTTLQCDAYAAYFVKVFQHTVTSRMKQEAEHFVNRHRK